MNKKYYVEFPDSKMKEEELEEGFKNIDKYRKKLDDIIKRENIEVPIAINDSEKAFFENKAKYCLNSIKNNKKLKNGKEKKLAVQLYQLTNKYLKERNRLIEYYLPYVNHFSELSWISGLDGRDMVQQASIELIKAIENYDNGRLSPMAYFNSRLSDKYKEKRLLKVSRYKNGNPISIPFKIRETFLEYFACMRKFIIEGGRKPTEEELKNILKKPLCEINRAQRYGEIILGYIPIDPVLDKIIDPKDPDREENENYKDKKELILRVLMGMKGSKEDKAIFMARNGLNKKARELSFRGLGRMFNYSAERIRQKENKILERLKIQMLNSEAYLIPEKRNLYEMKKNGLEWMINHKLNKADLKESTNSPKEYA